MSNDIKSAIRAARNQIVNAIKGIDSNALFRGEDELFRDALATCKVYGEYGCGASTIWCANNSAAQILSVDTSSEWIETVRNKTGRPPQLQLVHVDLGALGDWGRPRDYSHRDRFADYIAAPWRFQVKPDVVLVDGRFRVACFLTSLIEAEAGTTILFDDYADRPHYHVVEDYVSVVGQAGTQVKFIVPDDLDRAKITEEVQNFLYVMD